MATPPAKKKDAAKDAPRGASKKTLILIIAAVLVVAGGGAGAAWYFMAGPGAGAQAKKPEPPAPPIFLALDTFTVNLPPDGVGPILQTTLNVQVATQADADRLTTYMPLVRSRVLQKLAAGDSAELATAAGKQKLAADLQTLLATPMETGVEPARIKAVLFNDFVIQHP